MEQNVDLKDLYLELKKIEASMVTKEEMTSFMESVAVMENEETMEQISGSGEDFAEGRAREVNSVDDL